ncbi:IMS domain-containing protein [Myxosarcina sp. GI1(2024)]
MKSTVQIPLDYYRILSVPVTATEEQLQQAYRDRLQQKPRREYGEGAIVARQQLIESAYEVLSDLQCRAEYDSQFFGKFRPERRLAETGAASENATFSSASLETTPVHPTIEIPTEQMSGALLILYEMGEYQLVLKLGINYLNSHEYAKSQPPQNKGKALAEREDIILSLALSYLELGREQWQRREYENAALSGKLGLKLLAKENLFPQVKQELEIDLYRLQPYRILELIAHNPVNSPQRNKGLQLLANLLRQRQEMEARGQAHSKPSFEQFLCFIQQIRTYLTSAEQEELFVREAQHSSAIGNYLAVYALLARGYALKQPASILRAQNMLETLSQRQDVYWELTICSLLLGLSDRALSLMRRTKDRSKLNAVQQHCQGSEDLLLGLCVYGEDWLKSEVLMQFCDLANSPITLKEYFADPQVQSYLEKLAPAVTTEETKETPRAKSASSAAAARRSRFFSRWGKKLKAKVRQTKALAVSPSPHAERFTQPLVSAATTVPGVAKNTFNNNTNSTPKGHQRRKARQSPPAKGRGSTVPASTAPYRKNFVPTKKNQPSRQRIRGARRSSIDPTLLKLLFLFGLIFGLGTLGFAAMKLFLNRTPQRVETEPQLFISLNRSLLELPPVQATTNAPTSPQPKLTFADEAKQVVQRWLDSKSAAFGEAHQVEKLNEVLIGSLLTTWRDRALNYQQTNTYREYDHKVTIKSAVVDSDNPDRATIEAEVKEVARHYYQGNLDDSQSYDDDLLVRYNLVRQGNKWMIAGSEVLEIF